MKRVEVSLSIEVDGDAGRLLKGGHGLPFGLACVLSDWVDGRYFGRVEVTSFKEINEEGTGSQQSPNTSGVSS